MAFISPVGRPATTTDLTKWQITFFMASGRSTNREPPNDPRVLFIAKTTPTLFAFLTIVDNKHPSKLAALTPQLSNSCGFCAKAALNACFIKFGLCFRVV